LGDCHEVKNIFSKLIERGILPSDGDYGDNVRAHLVWLSDGKPWFKDHILPLLEDVVVILDVYHLMQAFGAFIALCYKPNSKQARRWMDRVAELTVGPRTRHKKAKPRKGHRKRPAGSTHHAHQRPVDPNIDPDQHAATLFGTLFEVPEQLTKKAEKARNRLLGFMYDSPSRINYVAFRARGYQISSGAAAELVELGP
jgi:hypothetical protein